MSTALANQDFTAEDNVAGQTLLRLVSRGSAIIAELLRLSDHVPQIFTPRSDKQQARRCFCLHSKVVVLELK